LSAPRRRRLISALALDLTPLRSRDFRLLFLGQFVSAFGSAINQGAFKCGSGSVSSMFLFHEQILFFDEEENPLTGEEPPVISPIPPANDFLPFALETQSVTVGEAPLPIVVKFGWFYLNLNHFGVSPNPPEDPAAAQAWVSVRMTSEGRFSVGYDAVHLDSACEASHFFVGE
jgi:hypothetical protein